MQSRRSRQRSSMLLGAFALALALWQWLHAPDTGHEPASEQRPAATSRTHADQQRTAASQARAQNDEPLEASTAAAKTDPRRLPPRHFVEGMRILDERGDVLYRGRVDLQATLERIASGGHYPHRNDGATFQNRPPPGEHEPALPRQERGYYREYVHPTPGLTGPGPQRIVVGRDGDFYYTPDHYQTFIPLQ